MKFEPASGEARKASTHQEIVDAVYQSFPHNETDSIWVEDVDYDKRVVVVNINNGQLYAVPFVVEDNAVNILSNEKYRVRKTISFIRANRKFAWAFDLYAAAKAGEISEEGIWVQLFPPPGTKWQYPTGTDKNGNVTYKEISYTKEQYEQAVANFEKQDATELSTNYEHVPVMNSRFTPEEGKASGWIKKLEARDDGLWALWMPTEAARKYIAEREYRYFSPEWQENAIDVHTKEKIGFKVTGGGLTNDPFFEGMQPIELAASVHKDLSLIHI